MVTIVFDCPRHSTNITKLILAPASDVIASLILLNYYFTPLALPVLQIILKKQDLLTITVSLVHFQQTFTAKFSLATVANHQLPDLPLYNPVTVLLRTQLCLRVLCYHLELTDLLVVLLNIGRQLLKKVSPHVENRRTPLARTVYFLKVFDLVDHVVVKTRFTKVKFMFTIAHVDLLTFILRLDNIGFADLTGGRTFYSLNSIHDPTRDKLPEF